jgi:hypothetical protein
MNRSSIFQFIGAILLLAGVIALNVVWYGTITNESAQATQIAGEIKAKTDDTARAAAAKVELAALSTDQSSLQQYFVSTSNVVPFLEQLQSAGSYLGSKVQIASVSATPGTPYGQLSLSLSIAGSFNSVMRTLGSIEYGSYDTEISSLSLDAPVTTTGAATSASPQWTANAVFSIGTETEAPVSAPVSIATTSSATNTASGTVPSTTATPTP